MTEAERGLAGEAGPAGGKTGRRSRALVFAPLAIFGLIAIAFVLQIAFGDDDLPSALINRPAPEFAMPPLEGLADANGVQVPGFATADLQGAVTVVNVFGSWCAPCRLEHPFVNQLAEDGRFRVFGINQRDTTTGALAFLASLGNPYDAVGIDPNGRVSIEWGVYGVPETYLVDRNGVVRYRVVGQITASRLANEVMPRIEALLAEAPGG